MLKIRFPDQIVNTNIIKKLIIKVFITFINFKKRHFPQPEIANKAPQVGTSRGLSFFFGWMGDMIGDSPKIVAFSMIMRKKNILATKIDTMKLKKRKIKYAAIFFLCWFALLVFLVDGVLKFQTLVDYFGSYALVETALLLLVALPTLAVYRFTKE